MAGIPRTIDAYDGVPGPSQSFTLPKGVTLDVEAVYIEVDATGTANPVTAELTIAEQSGVVIAKEAQTDTIDAPGVGSATWALRLGGGGGRIRRVDSPLGSIAVTNPTGPVVDIDVPAWRHGPAIAYGAGSITDISAAFLQDGDSCGCIVFGDLGFDVEHEWRTSLAMFAYVVVDPSKLIDPPISVPLLPGVGNGLNATPPLLTGRPLVIGTGRVLQQATGNVYPAVMEVWDAIPMVAVMRLAGTPGSYVTATNPIVLAVGDRLSGSWTIALNASD